MYPPFPLHIGQNRWITPRVRTRDARRRAAARPQKGRKYIGDVPTGPPGTLRRMSQPRTLLDAGPSHRPPGCRCERPAGERDPVLGAVCVKCGHVLRDSPPPAAALGEDVLASLGAGRVM